MASRSNVTIKRATGFIYAPSLRKLKSKAIEALIHLYLQLCYILCVGFHGFTVKCDDKRATGFMYASSVRKIKSKAIENLESSFDMNG